MEGGKGVGEKVGESEDQAIRRLGREGDADVHFSLRGSRDARSPLGVLPRCSIEARPRLSPRLYFDYC